MRSASSTAMSFLAKKKGTVIQLKEFALKYGCNPNQQPARIFMENGALPLAVLNGRPGYINLLDALNGYQLARELKEALGLPAAASFKHVSPAGAAVGLPLDDAHKRMFFVEDIEGLNDSPVACAYARARGADRLCSFGDWIALSDVCDETAARVIQREVSDGIIAPGYTDKALEILKTKRKGGYNVVAIDPTYEPEELERKQVFGVTFEQRRNDVSITPELLATPVTQNKTIPPKAKRDLALALITLKYTQSNSVCYAFGGQTTGVGAGQQSRIHCTRLAGGKSDLWQLRRSERVLSLPFLPGLGRPERDNAIDLFLSDEECGAVLEGDRYKACFTERPTPFTREEKRAYLNKITGVSLGSDAFFPFADNIERAARSGVSYIAQPGGSIRDDIVINACDKLGIAMVTGCPRLFHH